MSPFIKNLSGAGTTNPALNILFGENFKKNLAVPSPGASAPVLSNHTAGSAFYLAQVKK